MFMLISVSLILTCKCDSVENVVEAVRDKDADQTMPEAASQQHEEESSHEEVQAEEQQWHTTDFGMNDAHRDNKADSGTKDSRGDSRSFTPSPAKDHFQEELVIRPLRSGDIYATFQFGTQLDADFLQEGKKGCL